MSTTHRGVSSPTQDLFVDSLESEIEESLKDPQYRAAFEDSNQRHEIIDALIERRKDRSLTQKQVAERIGVGQSTVAGFENEGSDPRLSTVQRYARAVEARCVVSIQYSIACDWVQPVAKYHESGNSGRTTRVDSSTPSDGSVAWAAAYANRTNFGLAA